MSIIEKLLAPLFLVIAVNIGNSQCYTEVAEDSGVLGIWGISGFTGGGGISFVDYNEDGFDDLTFATTGDSDLYFYTNNGDGTFTQESFVSNINESKSVLWVDYDNDGDKDLFVACFQAPNRLYENDGNLNFTDVTASLGLPLDNATTIGANFGDYDMDGFLDLYITNYGDGVVADTNSLYKNINGLSFEDVTAETGTQDYCEIDTGGETCDDSNGRQSFCSLFFDYDLDGDQDLYISNDRVEFRNALLENNDGVFTEVSVETKAGIQIFSMNTGFGDCNGDGYYDLYCTNVGPSSHLIWDPAAQVYIDEAEARGTIFNKIGWGGNFFDYDLDGDLDLYVSALEANFDEPNALYVNDGTGFYTEPLANSGGLDGVDHVTSYSNAIGDLNNDGLPDIAVSHAGDNNFFLFENCEAGLNNFVKLDLEGTMSNKDALGARVEIYTPNTYQITQKVSSNAYIAQNSDIMTIGVGSEASIDSIVITWPFPNSKETYTDISINSVNLIVENSSGSDEEGDLCFTDETEESNIDGSYGDSIWEGGGGVSFVDFNDDGFDDLSFTTEYDKGLMFFQNNGDGTFTEVTPFITNTDESKHILWVDYDNDGDKDIFLTCYDSPNRLFQNDGSMNFTDVTADVGLPLTDEPTFGANFGDIDQDGFLDLYITNYGIAETGHQNYLYQNINGESFTDITDATDTSNGEKQSFCSTFFDYDMDGDLDLYVSNDRINFANELYENDGNGNFEAIGEASGAGIKINSMNVGIGDTDGDGFFDIYCTDTQHSGHLIYNSQTNNYSEEALQRGTIFDRIGWGGSFFDYDNDGDQDLYVNAMHDDITLPNALYVNNGSGFFTEPLNGSGGLAGDDYYSSFVNVVGDIDNDGRLDIVTSNNNDIEHRLFNNCEANTHDFIKFDLQGTDSNFDAYGALITVHMPDKILIEHKFNSISYLGQHSDLVHFGLGTQPVIDSVVIDWPYGDNTTTLLPNDLILNDVNFIIESASEPDDDPEEPGEDPCYTDHTDASGVMGSFGNAAFEGGGGASFADFNNDGFDDLSFTSETGQHLMFFQNNGDGTYIELEPFIGNTNESKQIIWVDYDNDGDKDIFLTCWLAPNRLFQNDGNLNFTEVTSQAGLPVSSDPTFGASFGDIDQDGFLDLYISNYGFGVSGFQNYMYRNNAGVFEDITASSGTNPIDKQSFCSTFFDYDMDGDLDLYVTNDRVEFTNDLFENDGTGNFEEVGLTNGAGIGILSMNAGIGDSNGDGYFDIYCTDGMSSGHLIYNPVTGQYTDEAEERGTIFERFGWGGSFFDYDNDGDQDLYVNAYHDDFNLPNALFVNDGNGFYTEPFGSTGGLTGDDTSSSYVNIIGDVDNDGMLDIVTTNAFNREHRIFNNCETNDRHFIKFDLEGVESNFDAIGALISVHTPEKVYVEHKFNTNAYLGQHSDYVHFGLGTSTDIDSVVIDWPYGDNKTVILPGDLFIDATNFVIEIENTPPPPPCAPWTPCDDEDECTEGEIFDTNCNCIGGTITDNDGDGFCSIEDPDDNDPCIPDNSDCDMTEEACEEYDLNDFEIDLGIWIDGGAPVTRYNNTELANSGDFSVLLSDNTDESTLTTEIQDFSGFTEAVVDFSFLTFNFTEITHDFWLQLSTDGGSTFTTIETWSYNTDFENLVREFVNIPIEGPFTDQTQLRIRCDAESLANRLFVDDLLIETCFEMDIPDCDVGSSCSDGDDCTIGDALDEDCNCVSGIIIDNDDDGYCSTEDPDDDDPCIPDDSGCTPPDGPVCDTYDLNDFEIDLGLWIDGGYPVTRYFSTQFSNSGEYCVLMSDNSDESILTTETIDFSEFNTINFDFNFVSLNFNDPAHDFWLQLSTDGGTSFTTIETWAYSIDFENNVREFVNLEIEGPFTEDTQLRVRCDAEDLSNRLFIDDLHIETCLEEEIPEEETCIEEDFNDAESGFGVWNDGGADAALSSKAQFAYSGTHAFLIKDNTETSVITTDPFDFTDYDFLKIDFTYITTGFNNVNQDFWLQISTDGGLNFSTIEEWNYTDEFDNNLREFENVSIPGPFSDEVVLRFRCDATGNNDKVYIDDIYIEGCDGAAPIQGEEITVSRSIESTDLDFNYYPNPLGRDGELFINILTETKEVDIYIHDIYGKLVYNASIQSADYQKFAIDAKAFSIGTYLIQVKSDKDIKAKKLLVVE